MAEQTVAKNSFLDRLRSFSKLPLGRRPNEDTKGREHQTRLRAHVPCPRTDFDGVGQNLLVVDYFRIFHLQIFPIGAGHGDEVSVCAGNRAAAVFDDFDYYWSRVPRDGDGPARQQIKLLKMEYETMPASAAGLIAGLISVLGLAAILAVIFRL
jgi:hypothetical protein